MRSVMIDLLGLAGFGALECGLYLQHGLALALQVGGGFLLAVAIIATWVGRS